MLSTLCYTQDDALMHIVNSDSSLELRQQKIDSLVKIKDSENPNETPKPPNRIGAKIIEGDF